MYSFIPSWAIPVSYFLMFNTIRSLSVSLVYVCVTGVFMLVCVQAHAQMSSRFPHVSNRLGLSFMYPWLASMNAQSSSSLCELRLVCATTSSTFTFNIGSLTGPGANLRYLPVFTHEWHGGWRPKLRSFWTSETFLQPAFWGKVSPGSGWPQTPYVVSTTLKSSSSCLQFPGAGTAGIGHHAWH